MMQASQTPVIWTTIIVGILLAAFVGFAVNGAVDDSNARLANIEGQLTAATAGLASVTSALGTTEISVEVNPSLCNNINGCDGLWDSTQRSTVANRVLDELTENGNKDLFRLMEKAGIDVDDDSDIDSASVKEKGEILTDQDPRFGFDEDRITTADIMIRVEYTDDDGHDETDYFRVQATLDELENGYDDGDVTINSFEEVRKRFVLPSR